MRRWWRRISLGYLRALWRLRRRQWPGDDQQSMQAISDWFKFDDE